MIIVTVQYVDNGGSGLYNGGTAVHFYNLNEATLFALNESKTYPGTNLSSVSLCKVYNDGEIVSVYQDGVDITG